MKIHKKWDPLFFLALPLTVYLMVVLIPIFFSVYYSLMDWNGLSKMKFAGFGNAAKMFNDPNLLICLTNTLKFTVAAALCEVGGGMILAILVLQIRRGRDIFRVIFFTPVIISSMAMSQTFKKLLSINPDGVVNALLGAIGLSQLKTAFLADMNLTLWVVAIVDAYKFCGLYLVIFYAALTSIDNEIIEAATIDGAKGRQLYTRIRLPMIRGIIVSCVSLAVTGTLKAFDIPFILTNGGPGYASELIALYMYKTAFNSMDYGYGSILGLLVVLLCIVSFSLIGRLTRQYD
ncbi:MAG: sugar ABC transporter permease [Treponema sp.]|jgi:raffinose/stachyose/melibiose transport system permease protein|nr:sugar ABC transporter permease [Treponema sp.]